MTLNEMIVAALQQLKRGRDSQTIDHYRGAFTQYANMAQQDLAKTFPLYRTDEVKLMDGLFYVEELPRWCTKVISVTKDRKPLAFDADAETGAVRVEAKGAVEARYRYVPNKLCDATDKPDLPEQLHQCIVSYMVGCDRSEGDGSTQGGASIYFQLYNEQKRQLMRGGMGLPNSYRIENM